ncbi:Uncharacterized protein DBV15_08553 [Temnothorax longispinosus]|uniref:Uncharacterized protein n=1 Tax=Temnothorax longispinosus TaxID=300112 RepID=A0A4S2KYT4_9HYME|nr:Uncharacterized protein DBV15_08553 [Temnothorax longispinosus]
MPNAYATMISGIAQWQASVLAINHGLPHCSPRTTNKKLLLADGVGGQKDEVRVGREVVDPYIAGNSDAAAPPPSSASLSKQPLSPDTAHFSYRPSYIPTFHFRFRVLQSFLIRSSITECKQQ